jgi:SAM-dependent methyltransferase
LAALHQQVASPLAAPAYAGRPDAPMATEAGSAEQRRRLEPRLWDTDWLVLRQMKEVIAGFADARARPGAVAIDFGCGARPYEALFAARGVDYRGADFGSNAQIAIDSDGRLSAGVGAADLVLSFQVLEHVRDLDRYLGEAARVLRPEGSMILSTHGVWLYHPHPEDHRRWTRPGLINDIEARGFKVIACVGVVGPLAWTTMVRLTCASQILRRVPAIGGLLSGMLAVFMNLRAALEDKLTPERVTQDNACVYITLCKPAGELR